jgi:ribonuclease HI
MKATIYSDGGARPRNPGHAGFASVINLNGERHVISRYIGIHTNNVAEYYGFIVGAKYAKELGATEAHFFTDSKLIFNHVMQNWNVRGDEIKVLAQEAIQLVDLFEKWSIKWVKRDKNSEADKICTSAIYHGMKTNPFFKRCRDRKSEEIDPFNGRATSNMMMPRAHVYASHAYMIINSINKSRHI